MTQGINVEESISTNGGKRREKHKVATSEMPSLHPSVHPPSWSRRRIKNRGKMLLAGRVDDMCTRASVLHAIGFGCDMKRVS